MDTKIDVKLKPFNTPNFVILEDGPGHESGEKYSLPLSAIDSLTLDRLCDEFRTAVFTKAGKQFPPVAAPVCRECEKIIR